jgi:putative ABC transport system permease protein
MYSNSNSSQNLQRTHRKNIFYSIILFPWRMILATIDFMIIAIQCFNPKNIDIMRIAFRNLLRNKRRTILISISISGAIIGLTWMSGWMVGMIQEMNQMVIKGGLSHVQISDEKYRDDPGLQYCIQQPSEIINQIKDIEGIENISPRISVESMISSAGNSSSILLQGINPEIEKEISLVGESIIDGDLFSINNGKYIIISQSIASKLNVKVGSKCVIMGPNALGEVEMESVKVGGFYKTGYADYDQYFAFVSLPTIQKMFGLDDAITTIAISVNDKVEPTIIRNEIRSILHDSDTSLEVVSWIEIAPTMVQLMNDMEGMMYAFYSIFYIAMAFGLVNTMLMAIFERRRELGVLLAIGMSPRKLKTMIMLEAVYITTFAGLFGTFVAIGLSELLIPDGLDLAIYAEALETFGLSTKIPFIYSWEAMVIPFVSAILFGMIAGFFPARRASKMNPVESIRAI